ncbi:MAG TPA: SDR family oxidoreductase [Beijerinckiaceae bacterium]|jgi:3-oxoacyl-[acyl-carrier protein] reductase
MLLSGTTALITGAGQGLGAAIAKTFVQEGASVLLNGRHEDKLRAVAEELRALAGPDRRIEIAPGDVASLADTERVVARAREALGRIDVLVNNAGLYGPMGRTDEVDWDEWVYALNVNLLGTVACCRAVTPLMIAQGGGKIVNVSGGGATNPLPRLTCYAASKAAVVRFTESLALELKEFGITVNALAPGALNTRMMDQLLAAGPEKVGADFHRRMAKIAEEGGTPLEVGAEAAAFLASPKSDGITGRLISAVWDPWRDLDEEKRAAIAGSDVYTLRRIVPADRGFGWGG